MDATDVQNVSLEYLTRKVYDLAIVGAGPAGVSAAINAAARKKEALLLDPEEPMSKIRRAKVVPNYPGLPSIKGNELADAFLRHMEEMKVEMKKARVLQILTGKRFTVHTEKASFEANAVILALGAVSEKKIAGEEELVGEGVSYCVTCDGLVYQGENVAVIADSKEGEDEARALAEEYQCKVTYLPQYDMSGKLQSVEVVSAQPTALKPRGNLVEVDAGQKKIQVKGVFIIRKNLSPATIIQRLKMKNNFIFVDDKMATSIKGVFAAGDCTGAPFQIAKAVGQGQVAALSAVKYLSKEE